MNPQGPDEGNHPTESLEFAVPGSRVEAERSKEELLYSEITAYMREAGQRLRELQGNAQDVGITKQHVTEEDFRIERELSDLVTRAFPEHKIYAEEEHDTFQNADNVWVFDPISATRAFIEGREHYAIVVSHIKNGVTEFAAVYDPSADEMFTARKGKGAFLNDQPIHVSDKTETVLQNTATSLYDSVDAVKLREATEQFDTERNEVSFADNYCWVAAGKYDGVVTVAKDSFPEFAGSLILAEAGGKLTNLEGGEVGSDDRLFIGGNPVMYAKLLESAREALRA